MFDTNLKKTNAAYDGKWGDAYGDILVFSWWVSLLCYNNYLLGIEKFVPARIYSN